MKKFLILAILLIPVIVSAQGILTQQRLTDTTSGLETLYVTSTGSCTTAAFDPRWSPDMGFAIWAADTTADDSVDLDVTLQARATDYDEGQFDNVWTSIYTDEATHTGDSTVVFKRFSTTAEEMALQYRYIINGDADNSISTAVAIQILHQSWFVTRRR